MTKKSFVKQVKVGGWVSVLALAAFFLSSLTFLQSYLAKLHLASWERGEWLSLAQLVIIFITAVIAIITMRSNRRTSCEVATLSAILNDYQDTVFYEAKMQVYDYNKKHKNTHQSLTSLFEQNLEDLESDLMKEVKTSSMLVLNRSEFFASAINAKVIDEALYKRVHCSNILRLWSVMSGPVDRLRVKTGKKTLFLDLEMLANKWEANPLKEEDLR
ncbi:DUF4760 domain-containing protein [Neisseriaceae bacterium CLB008]